MMGPSLTNDADRPEIPVRTFLRTVMSQIIDHPEELDIEIIEGERAIVIETRVAPIDAGRVIGREGRTINALRVLVAALAARGHKRAVLDIVDIPRVERV